MNTLLFTLEYPPFRGGVADYCGNLVRHWPVSAEATADKPEPGKIFVLPNNNGQLISRKLPVAWLPAIFRLWSAVRKNSIDHILVSHILPLGTVAYLLNKFTKTPYSLLLHGMDLAYCLKTTSKKLLAKKILFKAKTIICGNGYTADMVKRILPAGEHGKVAVVNPGVENLAARSSQLATQLKEKYYLADKIILLSVGRLVKRKGFDTVLDAMPKVLEQISNLVYVIIGDGPELKSYELRVTSYELKDYVKIINQAGDEERDNWYNACDIFIMPSRNIDGDFEGFGIVYLEANLAGKPVIAGDSGGVRDAVEHGVNGLLVNPVDTDEIARAIIKLAQDKPLRQRLGERGRERVMKDFSLEKQIDKIYKLIHKNK